MATCSLIHLEHALPPLAEMGLEHLVPLIVRGQGAFQALDQETVSALMGALSDGAKRKAARRLVMVAKSSAEELLEIEVDPGKEAAALRAAALLPFAEAREAIGGFFSSLGFSLNGSLGSLGDTTVTENPGDEQMTEAPSGSSADS